MERKHPPEKTAAHLLMGLFVLLGVGLGLRNLLLGQGRVVVGLAASAFLLLPLFVKRLGLEPPYKLYCLLFGFCILAYDIGCVAQQFDAVPLLDKVSHFLSGIVFTALGYCLYLFLVKHEGLGTRMLVASTYALFFSTFVAVVWEIGEFTGFLLTGHDSQHTLTTGVFDTMEDLISCLAGSLLSVGSCLLYVKKGIALVTGPVVGEFNRILQKSRGPARR